jgi:hypothetical protein
VLDHEGLEEDSTTRKLSLRADLANGELSMPLIYISTGGAVTVYRWLAKKPSERGVPADAVNRFNRPARDRHPVPRAGERRG